MHSQKMISLSVLILAIFGLLSCGGDTATSFQNGDVVSVKLASLSGQVQKGPFIKGSRVTAYELENGRTLAQTGKNFTGVIQSDNGQFDISTVTLASQYAILQATGYFRSEVTGGKSNSQLTLKAITDLTSRSTVNVNLLTHLEYDRVEYLVKTEGMRVLAAKKQAEKEIFAAFGIDAEAFGYSEDLSVLDTGDANAALLAVSILLLRNNSDADLTQELTEFSQDLAADGAWDDAETKSAIADWAHALDSADHFAAFRKNVSGWGISGTVPAFEKYMTVFWNYAYGLGGVCSDDIQDSVKYVSDTYSANAGRYYICKATAWRPATTLEYDTYRWKAGADGAVRAGNINTSIYYVYDSTAAVWRAAAFTESVLGGCRTAIDDSVGLAGSTYYICDGAKRTWNTATALEYDTYRWKADADGEVRAGNVNASVYYIYDGAATAWRVATALEYDTYRWKAGADGAVRVGNINTSISYVYDSTAAAWRAATAVDSVLGGCRTAIDDSVGLAGSTYYICDGAKRTWHTATLLKYDTYGLACTKDGAVVSGKVVSSNKYTCDADTFSVISALDTVLNKACVSYTEGQSKEIGYSNYVCKSRAWTYDLNNLNTGTIVYGGQTYKTIGIGNQMWMAENLNYSDSVTMANLQGNSWCYANSPDSCTKYGRLYTWTAAMNIDSTYQRTRMTAATPHRGICPEGWHVPTDAEWKELYAFVDTNNGTEGVGTSLKSIMGWLDTNNAIKGTDIFGFSAIPSGYRNNDTSFYNMGKVAYFWSASEYSESTAYDGSLSYAKTDMRTVTYTKKEAAIPLRCLKN